MGHYVALLRGINVGGQRRVPMAELRAVAEELGLTGVRTLIASGNLVFAGEGAAAEVEAKLEQAVERRFGFPVDIMVRTAEQWRGYIDDNPLAGDAAKAPKFLLLFVGKQPADAAALEWLRARSAPEERVAAKGDAVWIYFANGGGRSKLGNGPKPGLWTGRNWRTVLAIEEMLCSPSR
jgi:uncharacterized protein (DUF1697 family)